MKLSIFEFFNTCWWWQLLWMFASFLLGWWLARKFFGGDSSGDCCEELVILKQKYADVEKKYNHLLLSDKTGHIETVPLTNNFTASTAKKETFNPFAKLSEDNLQIVEGIGPKMEEVLHKSGITTWGNLSSKTFDELRNILDTEDPTRYKIIDPKTWPSQAKLAVEGNWQELIDLQKSLDTGKTGVDHETDSKLEKIMVKLGLMKRWQQDDLKAVEGIGPKIEELFHQAGIKTWQQLSETSLETMQGILSAAGDRFKLADPGTWAKQALLAAQGRFDELQAYQDELNGGK